MTHISVIVATYERCEQCKRAVASALAQAPPPLEVIVCDDGSSDGTQEAFEEWSRREARLRYLRIPKNTGVPAIVRNLGIGQASGDWLAFLDDDDRWLPSKLAAQSSFLTGTFDVIGGNAELESGGRYFVDTGVLSAPLRRDILHTNPIILSTAVARRSLVMAVGGFPTNARLLEDYALWLELADAGARFLVLPTSLVVYEDGTRTRFSERRLAVHAAIARYMTVRWLRRPRDRELARAALVHVFRALKVAVRTPLDYLGRRRQR